MSDQNSPTQSRSNREPRSVIAFVDGFNLYYGLLRNADSLKWLNLRKLMEMLYPHDRIVRVKYFSALVDDDRKPTTAKRLRQEAYWAALRASGVDVIEGRLEYRERDCAAHQCAFEGSRKFRAAVEKMTDVNIALHMVEDVRELKPNVVCIISGDTDLLPAMRMVRSMHTGQKRVLIPCSEENFKFRRVDEFGNNGWLTNRLKAEVVRSCRLEDQIAASDGTIQCPTEWLRQTPPAL